MKGDRLSKLGAFGLGFILTYVPGCGKEHEPQSPSAYSQDSWFNQTSPQAYLAGPPPDYRIILYPTNQVNLPVIDETTGKPVPDQHTLARVPPDHADLVRRLTTTPYHLRGVGLDDSLLAVGLPDKNLAEQLQSVRTLHIVYVGLNADPLLHTTLKKALPNTTILSYNVAEEGEHK